MRTYERSTWPPGSILGIYYTDDRRRVLGLGAHGTPPGSDITLVPPNGKNWEYKGGSALKRPVPSPPWRSVAKDFAKYWLGEKADTGEFTDVELLVSLLAAAYSLHRRFHLHISFV